MELAFEFVGLLVRIDTVQDGTGLRVDGLGEEGLDRLLLAKLFLEVRVLALEWRLIGAPVDEDLWGPVFAMGLQRILELPLGAGAIQAAIRFDMAAGEGRTQLAPQNDRDDVALGGFANDAIDGELRCLRIAHRYLDPSLVPSHREQRKPVAEGLVLLQAVHHLMAEGALLGDVARRGDEDLERHQSAWRAAGCLSSS